MKIAITYENGKVFQHFGHTSEFKIYDVEGNSVVSSNVINADGYGHESLADFLKNNNVDTLICGGIGNGAKNALAAAGIKVYGGVNGDVDEQLNDFLNKKLVYDPNVKCTHHHEHSHEDCSSSDHTCGGHCH